MTLHASCEYAGNTAKTLALREKPSPAARKIASRNQPESIKVRVNKSESIRVRVNQSESVRVNQSESIR
eukprot:7790752-Karenia_brevis.AAC.1